VNRCAAITAGVALLVAVGSLSIAIVRESTRSRAQRVVAHDQFNLHAAETNGESTEPTAAVPDAQVEVVDDPDPMVASASAGFARFESDRNLAFSPPPGWIPPRAAPDGDAFVMPRLRAGLDPRAQLEDALRWFQGLPRTQEISQAQIQATRTRLEAVGIDLQARECRSGICRMVSRPAYLSR
jgi:hypothetical protein